MKKVDVTGTSKGKGFAGVMKRYGFAGGPGGHGAHFHRAPGSVGQCATPSRVFKGLRLPGHMGCDTVTVKNLEVVRIDEEQNLILVKGAVPGGQERHRPRPHGLIGTIGNKELQQLWQLLRLRT